MHLKKIWAIISLIYIESYPEAIKSFPSIKVANYSTLTALYLIKSTSKIFEVNENLELEESIRDFSKFIKEKYSEYEKNVLGY